MMYLSLETKKKIQSVGFSFPDYENFLNFGMTYSYQNDEYVVGGFCSNNFTETDELVSQRGEWLPDASQLLQWLQQCRFDICIIWKHEESRFHISATQGGIQYEVVSVDLTEGLGSVIYQICKSKNSQCNPERLMRLKAQD